MLASKMKRKLRDVPANSKLQDIEELVNDDNLLNEFDNGLIDSSDSDEDIEDSDEESGSSPDEEDFDEDDDLDPFNDFIGEEEAEEEDYDEEDEDDGDIDGNEEEEVQECISSNEEEIESVEVHDIDSNVKRTQIRMKSINLKSEKVNMSNKEKVLNKSNMLIEGDVGYASERSIKLSKRKNKDVIAKEDSTSKVSEFTKNTVDTRKVISQNRNDEYENYDSSDEEDIRNTVGNIPMNWYNEYKHMGYDWDGNQILKPETGDSIDNFLKRIENPDFWRTVKDPQTGKDVVLSDEDINLIKRIQGQKIPDANFDEYAPWIEWFTSEVMKMPLRKFPEHKRSFLPSRTEARKVSKLVHALKMGWIKTKAEEDKLRAKKDPQFYMLWSTDDQSEEMRRIHKHIAAPKRQLPGHSESYNPPPEYLFDERELKKWNKQKDDPMKRKLHFIPQKFDSLRKVPAYSRYIKERFLRCLDLYLCPRAIKMRLTIEPEALVPKLPSPKDLQPFPNVFAIEYKGHGDMIRCITLDKSGQYLATGSDDTSIKIWEVNSGRCLKTIKTKGIVRSIEWCPNTAISLILVASNNRVLLINPNVGDFVVSSKTDAVLQDAPKAEVIVSERVRTAVVWDEVTEDEYSEGIRLILKHFKEVTQVTWHGKGDYFATVMPDGQNRSVLISQISKRRSQIPFSKSKGLVQSVLFHPIRPYLFVATQKHVRVYDLVKQQLVKKLMTNSRWISTMDIHPGGDNLLVATYDRKILWFDLDLSTKPYQTLRLHGTAVRGVAFHKRYPLFASGSDDRSLIVSHGMVYNDLLKNPLIVPLKRFQDHSQFNDFGIFAVKFHPLQPWVFSSGADGTVRLYSN